MPKGVAVDPENLAGIFVDREAKQIIHVTNDVLINQIRRESLSIGESFDILHEADLRDISALFSRVSYLLFVGFRAAVEEEDRLRRVATELSFNAANTLMGATSLLRQGFYLQAAILVRSILEASATVLHLIQQPDDVKRFESGSLPLKEVMRSAKDALPPFGALYGFFSEQFVHISALHGTLQPVRPYRGRSDELDVTIGFIRLCTWILYVTVELLFVDLLGPEAKYWRTRESGSVAYDPEDSTREWLESFLSMKLAAPGGS